MPKTLIIEDNEDLRFSIKRILAKSGQSVFEAGNLSQARALASEHEFDLVLSDIALGAENGIEFVRELRRDGYDGVMVLMTGNATIETAVEALREGADDYLIKPLRLNDLAFLSQRWLEHRRLARRVRLYERLEQSRELKDEVVGESAAWKAALLLATRLAAIPIEPERSTRGLNGAASGLGSFGQNSLPCILLLGETGVGKGVLARYIHVQASRRRDDPNRPAGEIANARDLPPFVHVNSSALPASLIEAELFGHEKGAFTDAGESRAGLFEMADGGTIFLDEISEMPLELQAKLLLVVEQGVFRRVGGSKERTVRARVIAASNQDLDQRARAGAFRPDLLYRLNAFTIRIPPLRDRGGDSVIIARAMLSRFGQRYGRGKLQLSEESERAIRAHAWPGNVRELANAVQRAAMLSESSEVTSADLGLAGATSHGVPAGLRLDPAAPLAGSGQIVFDFENGVHTADEVEKLLIQQALEHTRGNVSRAAKLIGLQRSSLRYRIERYQLDGYIAEVSKS
ncbi:MAG: sigma-54-dependent transcriptional regulator [Phycisphaerales bacterium]